MAKIEMRGLDEYTNALAELERLTRDEVVGAAVYDGADVVADEIRRQIDALPIDDRYGTRDNPLHGIGTVQKKGLQDSLGVSRIRDDNGLRNVKIGFAGYNPMRTKRWPNGQPNAMIARALERGTTWMTSIKFIKQGVAQSRKRCIEAMQATIDEKIHAILEK